MRFEPRFSGDAARQELVLERVGADVEGAQARERVEHPGERGVDGAAAEGVVVELERVEARRVAQLLAAAADGIVPEAQRRERRRAAERGDTAQRVVAEVERPQLWAAHRHLGELVVRRAEDAKRDVRVEAIERAQPVAVEGELAQLRRAHHREAARQRADAEARALRSRCIGYAARSSGSVDSSSVVSSAMVGASSAGVAAGASSSSPSPSPLPAGSHCAALAGDGSRPVSRGSDDAFDDAGEEAAGAVTASSSDQWRESSRAGDSSDSSSVSPTFETVERIASVGSPLGEVRRLSTVVGSVLAPPACFGGVAAIGAERSVLAPPAFSCCRDRLRRAAG